MHVYLISHLYLYVQYVYKYKYTDTHTHLYILIILDTLQIQNLTFSRVYSETRYAQNPKFSKTSIFPSLIILLHSALDLVLHADAVFFLAKLTVLACQTLLAMSWLA